MRGRVHAISTLKGLVADLRKNMNNENKLLEYDEVCPYSEGRAAVRKGEFWGYVDENEKLVITDLD